MSFVMHDPARLFGGGYLTRARQLAVRLAR
jgi:hypothetical protein